MENQRLSHCSVEEMPSQEKSAESCSRSTADRVASAKLFSHLLTRITEKKFEAVCLLQIIEPCEAAASVFLLIRLVNGLFATVRLLIDCLMAFLLYYKITKKIVYSPIKMGYNESSWLNFTWSEFYIFNGI